MDYQVSDQPSSIPLPKLRDYVETISLATIPMCLSRANRGAENDVPEHMDFIPLVLFRGTNYLHSQILPNQYGCVKQKVVVNSPGNTMNPRNVYNTFFFNRLQQVVKTLQFLRAKSPVAVYDEMYKDATKKGMNALRFY